MTNTSADNMALKIERLDLIHQAIRMDSAPKRVPHKSNYWAWILARYSTKPLSQTLRDYDEIEKCVRHFQEDHNFDLLDSVGLRNPMKVNDPLGFNLHKVNDENSSVYVQGELLMKDDEYPQFIEDMYKFIWEVLMPRRFSVMKTDRAPEVMKESAKEYVRFYEVKSHFEEFLASDYGLPVPIFNNAFPALLAGIDYFFTVFRGIGELSKDLRRHGAELEEACRIIDEAFVYPYLTDEAMGESGPNPEYPFDFTFTFLANTILNPSQFDRFYGTTFRHLMERVTAKDKILYIFAEGRIERYYNYILDYPQGNVALQLEQDDIYEARKQLPKTCLCGGMETTLLEGGTPAQCVDSAKRLIEEVGRDGGFILSQNKMISTPSDTNPENLLAVCKYMNEYWR